MSFRGFLDSKNERGERLDASRPARFSGWTFSAPSGASRVRRIRLACEQLDATTGGYHLRARYYDTGVGRFTARDSFGGDQGSPITMNHYIYSGDDPFNNTDPGGHDFSLSSSLAGSTIAANITSIQGGVFGYVRNLAERDIHSFEDFAWANATLAFQELFPGIVSALDALYSTGTAAASLLSAFDLIGYDINEDASSDVGDPPLVLNSAQTASRGRRNLGGSSSRVSLQGFPKAANQLNWGAISPSKVLGALYEAMLVIKIYKDLNQIIPDGGWGHNPNSNGLDAVSVRKDGTVYIWDAKGRSNSVQN